MISLTSFPFFVFHLSSDEGYVRIFLRGRPITSYMPSEHEGYSITAKGELPSEKLKLEWVYPCLKILSLLHFINHLCSDVGACHCH